MLKQIAKSMRASLPALGDISMSRTAAHGVTAAATATASVATTFPRRFFSTRHPTSVLFNKLGNNNRRFNFSSSFYPISTTTTFSKQHQRRLSSTITVAAALPKNLRVDRDVEEYWTQILEGVDKTTAKRLLPYVNASLPLGIPDPSLPRSSSSAAAAAVSSIDDDDFSSPTKTTTTTTTLRGARPPMYSYFLETKLQHPTKVILCQIGEFYETVGIDAILLVQYAGLNPMGKEGSTPRAGCPKANIRRTVADLVYGPGLSVVICRELQDKYQYGSKKGPKQRYIDEVVTPASPHYLSGLIDEDSDVILDYAPPLLGVAPQVGGFSVIEVDADLLTVRVTEGLTEDAVYARLHEGGLAPPLYVHIPPAGANSDRRFTEAISEAEWERRVSSVFKTQVGAIQKYDDKDPVYGMIERVKRQLNLGPDTDFRLLPAAAPTTRPRPLYFSTASNLGLHKTRGVPNLIDHALPAGAPLTSRRWLRKLLLLPPPPKVSLSIHAACAALQNAQCSVPEFPVLVPNNVVLKIRAQQANDTFFRELGYLCRIVAKACTDTQLENFAKNVLVVAGEETGMELEINELATTCSEVLEKIHDVVDHDTVIGTGITGFGGSDGRTSSSDSDQDGEEESSGGGLYGGVGLLSSSELNAYKRMFSATENFMGKIRPEKLKDALLAVENARQQVLVAASNAFELAMATTLSSSSTTSSTASKLNRPVFVYEVANNAGWIRFPRGASASVIKSQSSGPDSDLIHPRDRNGKIETGFYSTKALEAAQNDYRRACSEARDAVRDELKKLAEELQPKLTKLVAAATFAVVAKALDAHVREAARNGWALPQLTFDANSTSTTTNNSTINNSSFKVDGMFPYWLGGPGGISQDIVRNSFSMDGMFLLTGPNMAGKSTLLRSTCAVALLGASGLAVPASSSSEIPYFDAFMLRNFSADSPLEELSSFAVEMKEMRYVLTDVTKKSLVLVDELGKGTEARAGAALAGSMLEALDAAGCRGVFATHLHALLDMDLSIPGTTKMMMEVEEVDKNKNTSGGGGSGRGSIISNRVEKKATWRMVPGESIESLALEVAASQRLPKEVVDRAADLYSKIMDTSSRKSSGGGGGSGGGGNGSITSSSDKNVSASTKYTRSNTTTTTPQTTTTTASAYDLSQAAVLLESTASAVLHALRGNNPNNNPSISTETTSNSSNTSSTIQAQFVPVGMIPPVRTIGASCVYIGRRSDGWYYVGSSDSLQDRIKTHRQRGSKSRIADPKAEFAYVVVFDGGDSHHQIDDGGNGNGGGSSGGAAGASAAKSVEAEVIKAMNAAGFPLLSEADARKRYAPLAARNNRYL